MMLYLILCLLFVAVVPSFLAALIARVLRSRIRKEHVSYWHLPLLLTLPPCFLSSVLLLLGELIGPLAQDTAFAEVGSWIVFGSLVMAAAGSVLLLLMIFFSIVGWIDSKTMSRGR